MAGLDYLLDDSGDYIDDGEGSWEMTPSAASAVRHQLLDDLGAWVGDPDAGRERRGIRGRNAIEEEAELEAETVRRALEVLESEALITGIQVETVAQGTRFVTQAESRDTQTGAPLSVADVGEFGA